MSRQASMATIDAAILAASQPKDATPSEQVMAPGATLPLPVGGQSEAKKEPPKLTKEQEEILQAQEKLLGEEEARKLREEQEREAAKSQLVKGAQQTVKSAGNIVHGADVRVGSIPQPGGIAFPLILLLLCFFILIKVAGNTRLGWLWLVITNNARMSGYSHTSTGPGTPVTSPEVPENQPNTGQGSETTPFTASFSLLPANGVLALNGMF